MRIRLSKVQRDKVSWWLFPDAFTHVPREIVSMFMEMQLQQEREWGIWDSSDESVLGFSDGAMTNPG